MTASIPRLPLRDELFLLGHDDDTGHPHIHRQALALGLAGAVLIDLFLAGRVALDPNDDTRPAGRPAATPAPRPAGRRPDRRRRDRHHPLRPPAPRCGDGCAGSPTTCTSAPAPACVAGGILRQHTRRRLGGLVRADAYLATDTKWAVVARSRLRYLAAGREQPDNHTAALAGLVADLGLTEPPLPRRRHHRPDRSPEGHRRAALPAGTRHHRRGRRRRR